MNKTVMKEEKEQRQGGQATDTEEIPFSRLIRKELTARENGQSCNDTSIKALQYP